MKILITGCAGFIGFHTSLKLLNLKYHIIGIDNINNYYDVKLKKNRLKILEQKNNFIFFKISLSNIKKINQIVKDYKIKYVIHLAAQAGVRHSISHPEDYFESNLKGFFNILEISRKNNIKHLIFASTSSVYGENKKFPLKEIYNTDKPISFYAATKKSNEIMAHSYAYIYNLPCTAVRFFTVYGTFGRPDMALFEFTKNLINRKKIKLFNYGNHERDFTYVDDIVNGLYLLINKPSKNKTPFEIFNIGKGKPNKLLSYLNEIEKNLKIKPKTIKLPMQKGDIKKTHSDITKLNKYAKYNPTTDIDIGIKKFIDWYKSYFKIS